MVKEIVKFRDTVTRPLWCRKQVATMIDKAVVLTKEKNIHAYNFDPCLQPHATLQYFARF